MSSGCDKGSESSKCVLHHSLCPSLRKKRKKCGNVRIPSRRQKAEELGGPERHAGWGGRAAPPVCVLFPDAQGCVEGPSPLPPPLSVRPRGAGLRFADWGVHVG